MKTMKTTTIATNKKGYEKCHFTITGNNGIKCSGYNAYQGGYGFHGNNKYSKIDRKNGKLACKNFD